MNRFIHLLYVPTMNCNMRCRYCYLGENTVDSRSAHTPLETLDHAVKAFQNSGVLPFHISLHGGEVTTLSKEDFRSVIRYVDEYYKEHRPLLEEQGFTIGHPHIKTNLYGLHHHIDTIRDYNVSVSGSLDLPFSLHRQYRLSKSGKDTLDQIFQNIALLAERPNRKKVSATIFREHYLHLDEIISDIRFLHENTCLDMNDFNFMIGFAASQPGCQSLTPLTQEEQVHFFHSMHEAFSGSDLQKGLDHAWFAEFTPSYCTNCDLCGEKFFLLERNGDIYSCVRGQGDPDFYYGNIYTDSVEQILHKGAEKIFRVHNQLGFHSDCSSCSYLHLCKTGCPYVKKQEHSSKSYTCLLQQQIYHKNQEPPAGPAYPYLYLSKVHPQLAGNYYPPPEEDSSLHAMIAQDSKLQAVYDPDAFLLCLDGMEHPLQSQLLKQQQQVLFLTAHSRLSLYVRHDVMDALADYPINNSLYIMLLSGNLVVYGDEQREKQEHIMTHQIFKRTVAAGFSDKDGYYCIDLMPLLRPYLDSLPREVPSNLFFTTSSLRDYHYTKQKNNGFYHISALNLPFQNIEFFYLDTEGVEP